MSQDYKETKMGTTNRGFQRVEFKDSNNVECSLQESSSMSEPKIWIGCNRPNTRILTTNGWEPVPLPDGANVTDIVSDTRMHLTQDHVKSLLPYLVIFASTGQMLPKNYVLSYEDWQDGELLNQVNLAVSTSYGDLNKLAEQLKHQLVEFTQGLTSKDCDSSGGYPPLVEEYKNLIDPMTFEYRSGETMFKINEIKSV